MSEANKSVVRRFYEEVFVRGNLDLIDEISAPDFVDHNPAPGQAPGIEGIKQALTEYRSAFPDLEITVEDMIAEGDKVAARITATGTHKGEFAGIPATGRRATISVIDIVRVVDGKAVERWGVEDNMGLMQQLGVIPGPGTGGP